MQHRFIFCLRRHPEVLVVPRPPAKCKKSTSLQRVPAPVKSSLMSASPGRAAASSASTRLSRAASARSCTRSRYCSSKASAIQPPAPPRACGFWPPCKSRWHLSRAQQWHSSALWAVSCFECCAGRRHGGSCRQIVRQVTCLRLSSMPSPEGSVHPVVSSNRPGLPVQSHAQARLLH